MAADWVELGQILGRMTIDGSLGLNHGLIAMFSWPWADFAAWEMEDTVSILKSRVVSEYWMKNWWIYYKMSVLDSWKA